MADYTRITSDELEQILTRYDLGGLVSMTPQEGGQANSSFRITSDKGVFILSICDEKKMEEIDGLTQVLAYLEDKAFPTSRPVCTRNQERFIVYGNTPVYVKEFIPGQVIQSLSPAMVHQVGETLAELHTLEPLDGMPRAFPYGQAAFKELLEENIQHPYLSWLKQKKDYLEQVIDPGMEKGFIHGDVFWDNLVFSDGRLAAILDFEEACCYYKLFDLGMCTVGCCSENGSFDMEKVRNLVRGYCVRRSLDDSEKRQLPVFMEYAAVSASLWRFRQYNIRRPDPEKAESYRELSALADQVPLLKVSAAPLNTGEAAGVEKNA